MTLELHVLEGEQQGARTVLPQGQRILVGGAFDGDVVLRGAGVAGQRIALTAGAGGLQLQVLEGEAEAGGRRLAAGDSVQLPLDTPVSVGGSRIGVVRVPDQEPPPPDFEDTAPAVAQPQRSTLRTWSRRLAGGGAALAAVSIGVLAFAYSVAPQPPTPQQQAARAEALLHGAGLPRLAVSAAGNGELRIDGYLETTAQRARAEQIVLGEGLTPRWQVFVNEQVASAVQDVFRTHGVAARVEAVGPGAVRVDTTVADPRVLDSIRSSAKRDVPGLAALELRNDPLPAQPGPTPAIEDPGKRVASIVPGDPPYVVTVDGTRYFEGALLPTGHRIAGIEERRVVLDFNGVQTALVF
jgi:type III secretion protein D